MQVSNTLADTCIFPFSESIGKETHPQGFDLHGRWCNDGHDKFQGIGVYVWGIRPEEEEAEEENRGNMDAEVLAQIS